VERAAGAPRRERPEPAPAGRNQSSGRPLSPRKLTVNPMNSVIYLIGLVVVVLAILSFVGLA
jgi:hypothetical protein